MHFARRPKIRSNPHISMQRRHNGQRNGLIKSFATFMLDDSSRNFNGVLEELSIYSSESVHTTSLKSFFEFRIK